jgi:putative membrane protein
VIRLIVRTAIALVANAVGLLVAAALLEGVKLDVGGFLVAVVVFTVVFALMQPFLASQLQRRNNAALGGVSLIASLIALIVTAIVSDGLSINGLSGWIGAAVIVWAGALLAAFILPFLGLRKYLDERRD